MGDGCVKRRRCPGDPEHPLVDATLAVIEAIGVVAPTGVEPVARGLGTNRITLQGAARGRVAALLLPPALPLIVAPPSADDAKGPQRIGSLVTRC